MNDKNLNRGATLIELVSSIAILSIVGISCFMLLMFSIRSNSFIVSGTSACREAEILNNRLELLLKESDIVIEYSAEDKCELKLDELEQTLIWMSSELKHGDNLLQSDISDFVVEELVSGRHIRISYTIDNSFKISKVFSCKSVTKGE